MNTVSFHLTSGQVKKVEMWVQSLRQKLLHKTGDDQNSDMDIDYGAIGDGLTFMFTPTGLGVMTRVQESVTGEVLDVTDYDGW